MTDNLSLDLTEAVKNLDTVLNILGMANSQVIQKQKMDLRFKFAWDRHNLAGRSFPFTDFLFGDNLKESAIDARKEKSISRGVTGKKGKLIPHSLHQEFQSFLAKKRWLREPPKTESKPESIPVFPAQQQQVFLQPISTKPEHPKLPIQQLWHQQQLQAQGQRKRQGLRKEQKTIFPVIHYVSIPKLYLPVAGRLQHFKSTWYNLTSDPEIIDTVSGIHIDILNEVDQITPSPQLHFSQRRRGGSRCTDQKTSQIRDYCEM